jgi:GNAT superfamily N-acetyltransferase
MSLAGSRSEGWLRRGRRRPPHGIRRRTDKDLGACARLLRVVHGESRYPVYWPERPRAWLDDAVLDAWVAERLGEVLGHVAVAAVDGDGASQLRWRELTGRDPADLGTVSKFFVRPRVRGQGVGTALIDVAVSDIRARGLLPVVDVVSASDDALRLFDRLGWRLLAVDEWGRASDGLRRHFYAAPV